MTILIALVLGGILARTLTRPIMELTAATKAMAGGKLGQQVRVRSRDEIGTLAKSFNQMSTDVARSSYLRKQMTADFAHDQRTPLSILSGYTEGLSKQRLQGTPALYTIMHDEVAHLQRLVEDLRTLSLADAGDLSLNKRSVDPKALLERTGLAYIVQIEHRNLTLRVDAPEGLPSISVDTDRMTQVLNNLVSNALRSWNQAKNSLYQAQLNRASTCGFGTNPSEDEVKKAMGDPHCKQADLSVQSADLRERAAYQSYLDAQAPATQDELTKAYASVVQAQSNLATLQNGVSADQKAVYDLQLKQAQVTVDRASRDLAQAKLIAPCDCTVQEVGLSVGATANGSVTLLDTAQLRFATSNLDEQDVVMLKTGQTATIRLKAFDQTFTGKVGAVLPISSGTQGTVSLYTVLIDLDSTSAALLPGMTGQAEINLQ